MRGDTLSYQISVQLLWKLLKTNEKFNDLAYILFVAGNDVVLRPVKRTSSVSPLLVSNASNFKLTKESCNELYSKFILANFRSSELRKYVRSFLGHST